MNASTVMRERRSLISTRLPCLLERGAHALQISDQCFEFRLALDGLLRAGNLGIGVRHTDRPLKDDAIDGKMKALRAVGVPYTDAEIAGAKKAIEGVTEVDALIAYLQGLGLALKQTR